MSGVLGCLLCDRIALVQRQLAAEEAAASQQEPLLCCPYAPETHLRRSQGVVREQ